MQLLSVGVNLNRKLEKGDDGERLDSEYIPT